jgi:hypothetical protein
MISCEERQLLRQLTSLQPLTDTTGVYIFYNLFSNYRKTLLFKRKSKS